jgi:hypothetical protein
MSFMSLYVSLCLSISLSLFLALSVPLSLCLCLSLSLCASLSFPKDGPECYDSGDFTGRRYEGSSKPKGVPTFLWFWASKAARKRAKKETLLKEAAEKHDAAVDKERKYNRRKFRS